MQSKKTNSKFGGDSQDPITFNMESVSFDLAFEDFSKTEQKCPPMSKIKSVKIFAISKT